MLTKFRVDTIGPLQSLTHYSSGAAMGCTYSTCVTTWRAHWFPSREGAPNRARLNNGCFNPTGLLALCTFGPCPRMHEPTTRTCSLPWPQLKQPPRRERAHQQLNVHAVPLSAKQSNNLTVHIFAIAICSQQMQLCNNHTTLVLLGGETGSSCMVALTSNNNRWQL